MIFCVSFAEFVAFLGEHGYVGVGETDGHLLFRGPRGVITVHRPNGDVVTVIEVGRVCDRAGLIPPDLDQFWGD